MFQSDERVGLGDSREPDNNGEPEIWRQASTIVLTLACLSTGAMLLGFSRLGTSSMSTKEIWVGVALLGMCGGVILTPVAAWGAVKAWLNGWPVARWIRGLAVLLLPWVLLLVLSA